jgi:hypothetical protein
VTGALRDSEPTQGMRPRPAVFVELKPKEGEAARREPNRTYRSGRLLQGFGPSTFGSTVEWTSVASQGDEGLERTNIVGSMDSCVPTAAAEDRRRTAAPCG